MRGNILTMSKVTTPIKGGRVNIQKKMKTGTPLIRTNISVFFILLFSSAIIFIGNFAHAESNTFQASADSYVSEDSTENYGSSKSLHIRKKTGGNQYIFIKFDLSAIPAGSLISSATVYFYHYYNYGGGVTDAGIYELDDDSWVEEDITWGNKPDEGDLLDTIDCSAGGTNLWRAWDVTSFVNSEIENEDNVVSFCLRTEALNGATTGSYMRSLLSQR